jgi:hypothetical protein
MDTPDINQIMMGTLYPQRKGTEMQQTVPWWAYIVAVPVVIWMFCAFFSTMQPGTKIRRYKTVSGYRVRDWEAERELARKTRP